MSEIIGGFRALNLGAAGSNRKKPYTSKNGVANGKNGTIPLLNGWNKSHKVVMKSSTVVEGTLWLTF